MDNMSFDEVLGEQNGTHCKISSLSDSGMFR